MTDRFFNPQELLGTEGLLRDELDELSSGVAYPAERRLPPARCGYIPSKDADLVTPSTLGYEGVCRLISMGYAKEQGNDYINLVYTYKGRRKHLELLGFKFDEWLAYWLGEEGGWYICCNKAIPTSCVCTLRTKCQDHGDRCHGSHD